MIIRFPKNCHNYIELSITIPTSHVDCSCYSCYSSALRFHHQLHFQRFNDQ